MRNRHFCQRISWPSNGKLGPCGLRNLQRLEVLADLLDVLAAQLPGLRRQGDDAVVLDAQHFHLVEIDDGDDALDGPGVAVVERLGADPAEGARQPPAAVLGQLVAVDAGRPGIDHDQADVVDAALLQSRQELRRTLDGLLALDELVEHDRRLHAFGERVVSRHATRPARSSPRTPFRWRRPSGARAPWCGGWPGR